MVYNINIMRKEEKMEKNEIKSLKEKYLKTLTEEVIPFWLKYAIDESGAINNCITEDGKVLSRDRYIWSQGRALYTFSSLCNSVEDREEYRIAANGLFDYLSKNGRDEDGKWMYLLDGEGNIKERDTSIYVDGFVLIGMTEYYLLTKNPIAKKIALETYESTLSRINNPGSYNVAPYVIEEGTKTHGVNMIFASFYNRLGEVLERDDIKKEAYRLAEEILSDFYIAEKDALLEFVTTDGKAIDSPMGRACVPGHAIESMWFLIKIFASYGQFDKIKKCVHIIRRHITLGMDSNGGGLCLALDIDGMEPIFWQKPTCKPWWVQLETLVATAYAYKYTSDEWFMDVHKELSKFVYKYYPSGSGEWYNWLDKDKNPTSSAALPVKDPFHLPRALMELSQVLSSLL